jgi:hypothetical protein
MDSLLGPKLQLTAVIPRSGTFARLLATVVVSQNSPPTRRVANLFLGANLYILSARLIVLAMWSPVLYEMR